MAQLWRTTVLDIYKLHRSSGLLKLGQCLQSRITDVQWSLFSSKFQIIGLGQNICVTNFGAFGVLSADLSAPILVTWVPCQCFPIVNHYFYKKLSIYIQIPNTIFWGIVIWIWASKNLGFSYRVSVVRVCTQRPSAVQSLFSANLWFSDYFTKIIFQFTTYRVSHIELDFMNWLWQILICK
jgi:hypothetical protein